MFLSPLFAEAFATVTRSVVELYNTDGSQGAARGAGFGAGIYKTLEESFTGLEPTKSIEPNDRLAETYAQSYDEWEKNLNSTLNK